MIINNQMMIDNLRLHSENPLEARLKSAAEKPKETSFDNLLSAAIKEGRGSGDKVDKKLMDACIEYESIFVAKMLSVMRKSIQKEGWIHGGHAEEIFEDMLYDEYAHKISKTSNLGLADMLYNELSSG